MYSLFFFILFFVESIFAYDQIKIDSINKIEAIESAQCSTQESCYNILLTGVTGIKTNGLIVTENIIIITPNFNYSNANFIIELIHEKLKKNESILWKPLRVGEYFFNLDELLKVKQHKTSIHVVKMGGMTIKTKFVDENGLMISKEYSMGIPI